MTDIDNFSFNVLAFIHNLHISNIKSYTPNLVCQGRQLIIVICQEEAVLGVFSKLGHLDLLHTASSNSSFYKVESTEKAIP